MDSTTKKNRITKQKFKSIDDSVLLVRGNELVKWNDLTKEDDIVKKGNYQELSTKELNTFKYYYFIERLYKNTRMFDEKNKENSDLLTEMYKEKVFKYHIVYKDGDKYEVLKNILQVDYEEQKYFLKQKDSNIKLYSNKGNKEFMKRSFNKYVTKNSSEYSFRVIEEEEFRFLKNTAYFKKCVNDFTGVLIKNVDKNLEYNLQNNIDIKAEIDSEVFTSIEFKNFIDIFYKSCFEESYQFIDYKDSKTRKNKIFSDVKAGRFLFDFAQFLAIYHHKLANSQKIDKDEVNLYIKNWIIHKFDKMSNNLNKIFSKSYVKNSGNQFEFLTLKNEKDVKDIKKILYKQESYSTIVERVIRSVETVENWSNTPNINSTDKTKQDSSKVIKIYNSEVLYAFNQTFKTDEELYINKLKEIGINVNLSESDAKRIYLAIFNTLKSRVLKALNNRKEPKLNSKDDKVIGRDILTTRLVRDIKNKIVYHKNYDNLNNFTNQEREFSKIERAFKTKMGSITQEIIYNTNAFNYSDESETFGSGTRTFDKFLKNLNKDTRLTNLGMKNEGLYALYYLRNYFAHKKADKDKSHSVLVENMANENNKTEKFNKGVFLDKMKKEIESNSINKYYSQVTLENLFRDLEFTIIRNDFNVKLPRFQKIFNRVLNNDDIDFNKVSDISQRNALNKMLFYQYYYSDFSKKIEVKNLSNNRFISCILNQQQYEKEIANIFVKYYKETIISLINKNSVDNQFDIDQLNLEFLKLDLNTNSKILEEKLEMLIYLTPYIRNKYINLYAQSIIKYVQAIESLELKYGCKTVCDNQLQEYKTAAQILQYCIINKRNQLDIEVLNTEDYKKTLEIYQKIINKEDKDLKELKIVNSIGEEVSLLNIKDKENKEDVDIIGFKTIRELNKYAHLDNFIKWYQKSISHINFNEICTKYSEYNKLADEKSKIELIMEEKRKIEEEVRKAIVANKYDYKAKFFNKNFNENVKKLNELTNQINEYNFYKNFIRGNTFLKCYELYSDLNSRLIYWRARCEEFDTNKSFLNRFIHINNLVLTNQLNGIKGEIKDLKINQITYENIYRKDGLLRHFTTDSFTNFRNDYSVVYEKILEKHKISLNDNNNEIKYYSKKHRLFSDNHTFFKEYNKKNQINKVNIKLMDDREVEIISNILKYSF